MSPSYEECYELIERSAKLSAIERVLFTEEISFDADKLKAIKVIIGENE